MGVNRDKWFISFHIGNGASGLGPFQPRISIRGCKKAVCEGTQCRELTSAYHFTETAFFLCQVGASLPSSVCSSLSSLIHALYFSECFPPFPGNEKRVPLESQSTQEAPTVLAK